MLHSAAVWLTERLYRHCRLPAERKAVYIYGAELSLSTLAASFSIIIISLLLGHFFTAVLFLACFVGFRLFAGGFHASTYGRCFLLTNSMFLAALAGAALLKLLQLPFFSLALLVVSAAIIFWLAPIRNKNHPMSDKTFRKNRVIARGLALIVAVLFSLLYVFGVSPGILAISSTSIAAVAVMMIIPKWNERSVSNV